MRRIYTTLSLLLVAFALTGAAQAQDTWVVSCQLDLVEIDDPGNFVDGANQFTDQPKIADYPDLLTISSPTVGSATVAYSKDADPFGQFVLSVTNDLSGSLFTYGIVGHTIVPVVGEGWKALCWLEIELVDTGADGVWLRTDPGRSLMFMAVRDMDNSRINVSGMTLGDGVDLSTPGTHFLDAGVRIYDGPEARAMEAIFDFDLSPGDQAILTGRFELSPDLTPVETRAWSGVKSLFG